MVAKSKENASCYDVCPIGHNCFGGYVDGNRQCDKEIERIRTALKSQYTSHRVSFAPRNAEGLRFKVIDAQKKEMVFRLSGGEILSPNVK